MQAQWIVGLIVLLASVSHVTAFFLPCPSSGALSDPMATRTSTSKTAKGFFFANNAASAASSTSLFATKKRPPSKVTDPEGPSPTLNDDEVEEIDPATIPELVEITSQDELPHPIPHQPWRRGETAGCEAPIAAEWRQKAEKIITKSVELVGGRVLDVTWFLTAVIVTLDEEVMPPKDFGKSAGPVITVREPSLPVYKDPNDPDPEEIWAEEDQILYQRETEEEAMDKAQREKNMYVSKDADDPPEEAHNPDKTYHDDIPLFMNEETRDDMAVRIAEMERDRYQSGEHPMDIEHIKIDTASLSTIAKTILDALEDYEDELNILKRHELVLTSPGPPDVIETQRQFDAYRGETVIVETQDPFESNRTLKGNLVDRNSMDLMINKKGRLVTIPLNFVKCVRLPKVAP